MAVTDEGSLARVRAALATGGLVDRILVFDASTRTAAEAAAAIGCAVAQIAKSLVFKAADGGAVLVVASGPDRVDVDQLGAVLGQPVGKADPAFVRAATGFAIGGVSPVGGITGMPPLIDRRLLEQTEIWAAAGAPNAVFRVSPAELLAITGGRVVEVTLRNP